MHFNVCFDKVTWGICVRRLAVLMFFLVSLGGWVWLEREALLRGVADRWIVSDAVTQVDAVVVLGGSVDDRPFVAADLYLKGNATKVLVSQVAEDRLATIGAPPGHTETNRQVLLKLGVPAAAIQTFGKGNKNTRDEALALREWVENHDAKAIIIPVGIFSSRRVRWIFRRELVGRITRIEVLSIEPPRYTRANWWCNDEGIVNFQNEILKYIYYRLKY
jgi:uncharacterized SAM-binding protein YcdF (DUF218 family)